jgi:ribonuclease T2
MRALLPLLTSWAVVLLAGCDSKTAFDHYTLALSWEPAFCESKPEASECGALDNGDFAAGHLVLHGLWPSESGGDHPAYCGVAGADRDLDENGQWCALPKPGAGATTQGALQRLMPGTRSCLDRHEWLKHGTCSGRDADAYFSASARLTDAFQQTQLAQLLTARVGRGVARAALIDAFAAEFGTPAANALTLTCRKDGDRTLLSEVRVALKPDAIDRPLAAESLFLGRENPAGGCPAQLVIDRAGPG